MHAAVKYFDCGQMTARCTFQARSPQRIVRSWYRPVSKSLDRAFSVFGEGWGCGEGLTCEGRCGCGRMGQVGWGFGTPSEGTMRMMMKMTTTMFEAQWVANRCRRGLMKDLDSVDPTD